MDNTYIKVLLVDDDEDDYVLTRDWFAEFQDTKFKLEWVATYDTALEAIAHNQYEVYLFDYRLNQGNGLELLRAAIALGCSAPIILLTGQGDRDVDVEAMKAGAADYLEKGQLGAPLLERSIRYAIERKQAEHKIREQAALLDITTDAILVRSLEQQILFWNKGAEHLLGWHSDEVLGKNADELLYKQRFPDLEKALKSVVEKGEWQGELRKLTKSGKEIIVESRWTLVRNTEGKPKSILTVDTDLTEKKQLEAQFLRAQRMESIGTLASGIAHDLNNVLAPILMTAQLLETQLHDPQSQRLLSIVVTNVKRGATLVKQVLSFARGLEGERTILQVRHLIAEIKHVIRETFPKSIESYTNIDEELWTVSGDATQLHQVLMNLCVNARDAMLDGGTLTISANNLFIDQDQARLHLEAKVGPYILVTVADTGMGIPSEMLDRIFEPFFTTKELGKGTGLGLSTVLGIVKSHGGFINVQSELGKGTEFQVYLPAAERGEPKILEDHEPSRGQEELILIVDDEAAIREITKTSLELSNYRVLTASNGIEAVTLYAQYQEKIHVVLTDMMMPSMDGPTTIRMLQKINPQVKVIAVSGLMASEKLSAAANCGIKAFLSKPYTKKELLEKIQDTLYPTGENNPHYPPISSQF
jgi:two-component system cell cycle sensor histidine kinase/response regulator CckA